MTPTLRTNVTVPGLEPGTLSGSGVLAVIDRWSTSFQDQVRVGRVEGLETGVKGTNISFLGVPYHMRRHRPLNPPRYLEECGVTTKF